MLLAQAAGDGDSSPDYVVWATDVSQLALRTAEAGRYPLAVLADLPSALAQRSFSTPLDGPTQCVTVTDAMRARLRFVYHDLTSATGPPAGQRFSLVCCRNVLIYLQRPAQERAQQVLAQSLEPGGYLCLGEAEALMPALSDCFETVDRKARLFRLRAQGGGEE
jgi:two-component system CheB/CheR fusion protein